ncbi:hypothetical protein [Nereida ignava]|uniref:hypothetical protein n=1 Tax=Nereida ignava TaxID=282199 RepID=UPI0030FAE59C
MRAAFVLLVCATAYGEETAMSTAMPPTVTAKPCMARKFAGVSGYRRPFDDPCVDLAGIITEMTSADFAGCMRSDDGALFTSNFSTNCPGISADVFAAVGVCNADAGVMGVCTVFAGAANMPKPTAPPAVGTETKVSKAYTIRHAITAAQIASFNANPPVDDFLLSFFAHAALKDVDPEKVSMTMTKRGEVVAVNVEIEGRAIAASDLPASFAYSDTAGTYAALSDELAAPSASTEDDDDDELTWAYVMIGIAGAALLGGLGYMYHRRKSA